MAERQHLWMARSPTICTMRTTILPDHHHRPSLLALMVLLAACASACTACGNRTQPPSPHSAHGRLDVPDAGWGARGACSLDGGACSWSSLSVDGAAGMATPRSLWPFFRDLDLLRLLERATANPDPVVAATVDAAARAPSDCRADLQRYLEGLSNYSSWAAQMWDSSVRAPRGAVWGELWQMGNFDACLDAGERADTQLHLPGTAFCLATLRLHAAGADVGLDRDWQGSAWDAIRPPQHRLQVSRHVSRWGVCVPSSCGPHELAALLAAPLAALAAPLGLRASLDVDPELWQRSAGHRLPSEAQQPQVFWTLLIWLVTWVAFCSIADSAGKSGHLVRAFSVRQNWRALTSAEAADERDDIAVIHAAKVVGVLLVILGHRGEALMAGPLVNANDLEKMYTNMLDIILLNGSVIVDVFFVAAGSLLSWTILGYTQRGKRLSMLHIFAYRYLRLVPAYAAVIAFLALGLPALGTGPMWAATVGEEAHRCRQRWWTNLLFINNLVRQDQPCLDPSWYLACDTQLFVAAVPIVLQMHARPRLAARLLGLALLIGLVYPAAVTWRLGLDGTIIPTPDSLGRMAQTPVHMYVYVSAACRAGPYVAGLAAGWYLRHARAHLGGVHRAFLWAFPPLVLLTVATVAAGAFFYPPLEATTPRWVHVAYAGLHRTLCSAAYAVGLVVIASSEWAGEAKAWAAASTTSSPVPFRAPTRASDTSSTAWARALAAFRPWSRLSYCAYLTHVLVQLYSVGQQRAPAVYSTLDTITLALPDAAFAFAAALLLHLAVEAPCNALLHSLRARGQRRTLADAHAAAVADHPQHAL